MDSFKNDPIAMDLIQKNNELRPNNMILTLSTNTNIIHRSERESEDTSNNYNTNTETLSNPNEDIINNERTYRTNGPIFILKFYPNKFNCILTFFLNVIPGGLGTFLLGINRHSLKYMFGGIIHFILIDCLFILAFLLLKRKELFRKSYVKFLPIFLFITSGFFYLISIYIGIINNFVFINTKRFRKYHRKELGIFILLLNLIIPGLGTLMIQAIIPNKCVIKAKRTINGIIQLIVFIILFLFFTGLEKMNENLLLFIFLSIVEYLYTIGTSVSFLRNIMISEDINKEIEC